MIIALPQLGPRDPGPPASAPCDLWLCHAAPEATGPLKFSFIPNLRRMMDEKCLARWSEFDYGWYVIPAWPSEWKVAFCAIQPKNKVGRQVSNGNAFLESSVDLLGTAWSWRMTRAQPHSSLAGGKKWTQEYKWTVHHLLLIWAKARLHASPS